jgi:hypothetical protein
MFFVGGFHGGRWCGDTRQFSIVSARRIQQVSFYLRRKFDNPIKYIAVLEFQKSGIAHVTFL